LRSGPPDAAATTIRVPHDTSITAPATERALGVELPSVRELLARFRHQHERRAIAPAFS
jgi:hypothetical protein